MLRAPFVQAALARYGPKSASYLQRWFDQTGGLEENMREVFRHSQHEKGLCDSAVAEAATFIEHQVAPGQPRRIMTHQICVGAGTGFPYPKMKIAGKDIGYGTEYDWFNAIGGHVSYGYGWAKRRGKCFTFRFTWMLEDTFTMHEKAGESVDPDDPGYWYQGDLHDLHLEGLARDFWVTSKLHKTLNWRKGEFTGDCGQRHGRSEDVLPPRGRCPIRRALQAPPITASTHLHA